jgi:hypothetical protein
MAVGGGAVGEGGWGAEVVGVDTASGLPFSGSDVVVVEGNGASAVRVSDRPGQSVAGVGLNRLQPAIRNAETIIAVRESQLNRFLIGHLSDDYKTRKNWRSHPPVFIGLISSGSTVQCEHSARELLMIGLVYIDRSPVRCAHSGRIGGCYVFGACRSKIKRLRGRRGSVVKLPVESNLSGAIGLDMRHKMESGSWRASGVDGVMFSLNCGACDREQRRIHDYGYIKGRIPCTKPELRARGSL